MINIYKIDGDKLLLLDKLTDLNPAQDVGWIDLATPTLEEDHAVENLLKISIPTQEDMKEIEPSARLYDEGGADYMTMMAVSKIHVGEPSKSPVSFILHGNILVTVRYKDFLSLTHYLERAVKKNGVEIATAQGLMLSIIESFINRIADSLEELGEEMDKISYGIFRSKKIPIKKKNVLLQSSIRKIGEKGDVLGMLRESLASINRLMTHYGMKANVSTDRLLKQKLFSVGRDVAALADHANFMSMKMNFLLDATLGMINLEQNQIIKIFSIAAVVFLPPTLVASVYGMNFKHMPELNWMIGYPLVLILMIVSAIIPILYFRKKGWL